MATPMTDDQLKAITDGEMRQSIGWYSGKLAMMRQKALAYYLAEPVMDLAPPEIEGRSGVVSPDVRNVIESMLPQLMVKFAGSECVVEFEAREPGKEPQAEQATDYVNYIYHTRNKGEGISYGWMKDALLSKNGIIKVWWDTRSEDTREEYLGLSDVELSQLMDDEEIEITEQAKRPDEEDEEQRRKAVEQLTQQLQQIEQSAASALQQAQTQPQPQATAPGTAAAAGGPPNQIQAQAQQAAQQVQQRIQQIEQAPPVFVYDVVCKRSRAGGKIKVENVPPEEFLISHKAKSIDDTPFCAHRVSRTRSELKSMGYKNVDALSGDDQATAFNMERVTRLSFDDEYAWTNADQAAGDESQRTIWVTECYIRVDYDGDGIAELRRVVRAGNEILANEIVDCAPFVSITPVPLTHKFFGLSVADLAMEGQKINTGLLRGVLDNTWLNINGRYFAVEGQCNLDDLLASRPGGVVRMRQPGMAGRLDQGAGDSQLGMGLLEYMKGFNEDSTGWSRYNQGTDGDSLNQTATGVNIVTNRADMRLDLIARNFAEGFRDLFRLILKLVTQYGPKEDIVKLRGKWVPVNPREWRNGFDCVVNVGLGTGNKDQQVAHLMALLQQQQAALQIGAATPENVYQTMLELTKALGFKSGEKFFTDPAQNPQQKQPGPMDIEQVKIQGQVQIAQAKAQSDAQVQLQNHQAELQVERERMQMQAQVDTHRQQVEAQQKALEAQSAEQLERVKLDAQMQLEQFKAQMQRETAIAVAKINAEAQVIRAQMQASQTPATVTPEQESAADASIQDA